MSKIFQTEIPIILLSIAFFLFLLQKGHFIKYLNYMKSHVLYL